MKILAIADEMDPRLYSPALKQRYGDVKLVVSCGDLPLNYLEFIVSNLNVPLLYVNGNHAHEVFGGDGRMKTEPEGCQNIDSQVVNVHGVLVAGLEGSLSYNGGPYQYTEFDMRLKVLKMLPRLLLNRWRYGRAVDLLITHAAPQGIHDGTDQCHKGFQTFLKFMERFQPKYLVHGHLHVYTPNVVTETKYKQTTVINAFRYRVLEL